VGLSVPSKLIEGIIGWEHPGPPSFAAARHGLVTPIVVFYPYRSLISAHPISPSTNLDRTGAPIVFLCPHRPLTSAHPISPSIYLNVTAMNIDEFVER